MGPHSRLGYTSPSAAKAFHIALAFRIYHSFKLNYKDKIIAAWAAGDYCFMLDTLVEVAKAHWRDIRTGDQRVQAVQGGPGSGIGNDLFG